jgi:hypothetical protein
MTLDDRVLNEINRCRTAARKHTIAAPEAIRLIARERKRLERDFDPIPFLMQVDDADLKKMWVR